MVMVKVRRGVVVVFSVCVYFERGCLIEGGVEMTICNRQTDRQTDINPT